VASTGAAPESLSYDEARGRVLAAVAPGRVERVPLERARGRVLAADLIAPIALPPFRNSSMDGVAVRAADLAGADATRPAPLWVVGTIAAGHAPQRKLAPGDAMRIMTGAMLPDGADAVVPVEEVEFEPGRPFDRVHVRRAPAPGENVREPGADVTRDARVLTRGDELGPHALALAAALGMTTLEVAATPRVAVISTGDELVEPREPLRPGAIRDTNRPLVGWLVEEAGGMVIRSHRVGDDAAAVTAAVRKALSEADVVLTIGGVSAGDFDPVKQSLVSLGAIALWRVAMKPGRPQAFGAPAGRLFFGLPGNPASVACVFETLVRPALRKLQGASWIDRPRVRAASSEPIPSRAGRTDFVRVTLARRDGGWLATPAGAQVSGHLSPQALADGLLVVPAASEALASGETADVILWRWPAGGMV
jgi:molybdopterin molybdotransferase